MKILLIDDENELCDEIVLFLERYQYECHNVGTKQEALSILMNKHYDFVLLDLGLPDGNGLDILKNIKENLPDTLVVILSAKGDIEHRINGLEQGADDYLPKPFSLAELHARIQAIIRRKYGTQGQNIKVGDFEVNLQNRTVDYRGIQITLYKKEFDILSYLLLNKNRPLSRTQLYEYVWGDLSLSEGDSNYIDVHIKNIRKKLSAYAKVDWLESVRGIGYKVNVIK
ncbi:response regulator transcription factor [Sphingobacterium olei]|uniref:Response regulator transcription factor n=1 Tax=Sphingobacterium olei TaxID=2571155 RepID=A0A4U0NYL4_9SPHI|nr:response regulator transcription factor [Sphingobacterium olei]TJZ59961.1 response regulator transcription factor [Sphingobacterium olei]